MRHTLSTLCSKRFSPIYFPALWLFLPNPRKCEVSLGCAAGTCPGEVYLNLASGAGPGTYQYRVNLSVF
jgi:hypothetical protein